MGALHINAEECNDGCGTERMIWFSLAWLAGV
jgi:hypothetical protein